MKISLIQTNPSYDKAVNLARTRELMEKAVIEDQPDLIVLPECFEFFGGTDEQKFEAAETRGQGPAYKMMQDFARSHTVNVHGGSIMEKSEDADPRVSNTSYVFDRSGNEIASYRKIHLFDITSPDGTAFKESATIKPGSQVVTYEIDGMKVGCAICYDIRFSELFVALQKAGADVIVLPAAFLLQTGKDHWEVLTRARAIETQTYFVACGQWGPVIAASGAHKFEYGHSLVCDPWGHVVAKASDGVGILTTRIDPEQIRRVRSLIPMLAHRRLNTN